MSGEAQFINKMHVLIVSDVFVPVSNLSLCTSNQDSGQIVVLYLKSNQVVGVLGAIEKISMRNTKNT